MGGFGSTRWGLTRTRDTVETNCSLDINRLNRAGCLQSGYRGSLEWKRDGEQVAWIQFRRDGDRLILSYRVQRHGEEWQHVEQPTPIIWMPCRFGGARPYSSVQALSVGLPVYDGPGCLDSFRGGIS
jgi:hypothetical protein